jgi:hypothetical protein
MESGVYLSLGIFIVFITYIGVAWRRIVGSSFVGWDVRMTEL